MASAQAKHLTSKFTVYTVKIPFIIWDFRFGPRCTSGLRSTITRAFRGVLSVCDRRFGTTLPWHLQQSNGTGTTGDGCVSPEGTVIMKSNYIAAFTAGIQQKLTHTKNKHSIANNKYTAQCLQPPRCSRNWYIMNIFLWDIMQHENQYQEIYAVTAICCINID